MEHLAIDLGGRESQDCIRQEGGDILLGRRLQTAALKRYLKTRRNHPASAVLT